MKRVLLIEAVHPAGMALLERRNDIVFEVVRGIDAPGFEEKLAAADGVTVRMAPFDARLVAVACNLKIVSRHGVGYDTVDLEALSRRGIPLTVVGEVNSIAVAEQVLCGLLALARQVKQFDAATRAGNFAIRLGGATVELFSKTILILGFGRIGRAVAERCAAFGMHILVFDPFRDATEVAAEGAEFAPDLVAALGRADVVTLHAPLTEATRNLIRRETIAAMKPGAFLINTARGGLVEEAALAEALRDGRLGGAALDVYSRHPPQPENPLLALPNVVLSPHSAGLTRECAARMAIACIGNVLGGLDGTLDPALVVNRDRIGEGRLRHGSTAAGRPSPGPLEEG